MARLVCEAELEILELAVRRRRQPAFSEAFSHRRCDPFPHLGDALRLALGLENLSGRRYNVGVAANGLVTVSAPRRISVGVDYQLE